MHYCGVTRHDDLYVGANRRLNFCGRRLTMSLGDYDCTAQYNCGYRLLALLSLHLIPYSAPAMSFDSVTLISTLLLT